MASPPKEALAVDNKQSNVNFESVLPEEDGMDKRDELAVCLPCC